MIYNCFKNTSKVSIIIIIVVIVVVIITIVVVVGVAVISNIAVYYRFRNGFKWDFLLLGN